MLTGKSKASTKVVWRHVIVFALLAYAIAWALWASLFPSITDAISTGRTPSDLASGGTVALGMAAPAIAGIVMRLFVSREGLKRSIKPRAKWRIYAIATLAPMIFVSVVVAVVSITGLGVFTPGRPLLVVYAALLFIGVPIGAAYAFGEEYGWRGYLLPKLLPLGEVKASLIVALIWGPWHLPVLAAGLNYPGQSLVLVVVVFMLSVAALSLLHTRIFVASGASVLAVSFLHGSLNTFSDRLTDGGHLSGNPLAVSGGGVIATAIIALVMIAVYRFNRQTPVETARRTRTKENAQRDYTARTPETLAS